jgi:hypothetical protein
MATLRNNQRMACRRSQLTAIQMLPAKVRTSSLHTEDKVDMIRHSRETLLLLKEHLVCFKVYKASRNNSLRWAWEASLHNPHNHPVVHN